MTVVTRPYPTRPGTRFPPGITTTGDGVNFCIFSRHASRVELRLYAAADSLDAFQIIALQPEHNRSFFFWHVFVVGLPAGTYYTWQMDGPNDPSTGRRFYPDKELLDPWARAVSDRLWDRRQSIDPNAKDGGLRAIVISSLSALVPATTALRTSPDLSGAVIYELHVRGFTKHPSSGVSQPGLFAGLQEKIPYLKELGITHVEFLPIMAFDPQSVPLPAAERGLSNYWGYNTHSFWAPHPGYCMDEAEAHREFRELVDAFHAAGIGVLLDVVFNHTAEGGEDGPVISFRALGNDIFYHLDANDRQRYLDFTGCGNTVNCNHPLVSSFIVHCLEYWVDTFGVDGFRFDLASVFARGEQGAPLANPPLPWAIQTSRILSRVPVIAEAWDAAGLYQVGAFPGMTWSEWNGRYRDVMRRFVRGDPGLVGEVATRLGGSSDLYAAGGRCPTNSINFITSHDGFTLYDLVSYNDKHNASNGDENRDGTNDNLSWNCGVEGDTDDASVLALRIRQAKNLMSLLMLSRGVPMLLAGDEVLRSQRGNNNAYCQDNELSWFDWGLVEHNNMLRYTRELIALRRRHPSLTDNRFFTGTNVAGRNLPDIAWHGIHLNEPLWHDFRSCILACTIAGQKEDEADLHLIMNMSEQTLDAPLPFIEGRKWHIALDTAFDSPRDINPLDVQIQHAGAYYLSQPRSITVLEAR